MQINQNEESVLIGESLHDRCTYQPSGTPKYMLATKVNGQFSGIPMDEQLLSRHMLLLGGIGSGKSNAFNWIIRNTINNRQSNDVIIIFDTKGDYYKEFYQPGDVVIANDASIVSDGVKPNYWNIFNEIMIDDRIEENVLEISKTLFSTKIEKSSQPFFPNAAKDLFSAFLLHMIRQKKFDGWRDNDYLRRHLDQCDTKTFKDILANYPDLKAMQSYIYDENSGQSMGVMSELQECVREIFVGCFKQKGDLSIRQLVKNKGGKVIFLEYDLSLGEVISPVYRLIVDLAIKQALCRKENEGNVYFFLDEFRLLPLLKHMDDGVNFGRSLGAKFAIGIQNIDQVYAAYGEYTARSILSGFGTTFAFKVNDANSRTYIKDLFGKNIKRQTSSSTIQSKGISEMTREANVIEDEDINRLAIGECIVRTPNGEPFRFKFNKYD